MPTHRRHTTPDPPQAYYRAHELAARWRVHVSTIWRWAKRGQLARPTRLGRGVVAWPAAVVLAHEQRPQH